MVNNSLDNIDLDNREFQNAFNLVSNTNQSVFLTGKAGTGKSTFLKYICSKTTKKHIILAPTGIAAVNVGGMTMHSFFKMPLKPLIKDDADYSPLKIRKTLKYNKEKVKIIKELELIIIDEISMVRADMIDFMDKVLRTYSENMREPFGGKQLLLVGDIFQLEPVVTYDVRDILRHYYPQFFFFNAYAFQDIKIVPIELLKIYRQTDAKFIGLLDKVRVNKVSTQDIQTINSRYNLTDKNDKNTFVITLASRRDTVDVTNEEHLTELKTEEFHYAGKISGIFPTQNLPTALELTLKVGAQVIFIRNDREQRWVNGTIGRVSATDEDHIEVELENGKHYSLEPETWENMQYEYDEKQKKIKETVLGTFEQLPVKLAWALTIHKSQGLTFNNIIIDFAGGAFSSGQTYVALSRCTSLEGITLRQPLSQRDIIVAPAVVEFSKQFNNQSLIESAMRRAEASKSYTLSSEAFDRNDFRLCVESFAHASQINNELENPLIQRLISFKLTKSLSLQSKIKILEDTIEQQSNVLKKLSMEYVFMGRESMSMVGASEIDKDSIPVKSAIANYKKAIAIWKDCIDAKKELALLYFRLNQSSDAMKLYNDILSSKPYDYDANYNIGMIQKAINDYPSALKSLKKALKSNKTEPLVHDNLADIYDKIGLDDLAEKHRELSEKLRKKCK